MYYRRKNVNGQMQQMNVAEIRYTQYSISDTFRDGKNIEETINMLKTGQIKSSDIPAIRVVFYEGYCRTMDNRRLYCFKASGIKIISVRFISLIGSKLKKEFRKKNTSTNDGKSIAIRGDWFCDICNKQMAYNDKSAHLKGKKHKKSSQRGNNSIFVEPKKFDGSAIISWKPKIVRSAEEEQKEYEPIPKSKDAVYLKQLELEQSLSAKTKEIKEFDAKLRTEPVKSKSLIITTDKVLNRQENEVIDIDELPDNKSMNKNNTLPKTMIAGIFGIGALYLYARKYLM